MPYNYYSPDEVTLWGAGQGAGVPSWQRPDYADPAPVGMTPEAMWNQALSEYEARLKSPRPYNPADTKEALDRTILAPARMAVGIPQPKSPWSGPIETPGGGIVQVNSETGEARVVRAPNQTAPASDEMGKLYQQIDYWTNQALNGPPSVRDEATQRVADLRSRVQKLTQPATETPAKAGNTVTVQVPALETDVPPVTPQPAQPEIPGSGALGLHFWPFGHPAIPGKPAVAGKPGTQAHPPYSFRLNIGTNDPSALYSIPATGPVVPAIQMAGGETYSTAEDVRAAFKAGRLTRDDAKRILKAQFGME